MIGLGDKTIHASANSKLKKHSPSVSLSGIRYYFSNKNGTEASWFAVCLARR